MITFDIETTGLQPYKDFLVGGAKDDDVFQLYFEKDILSLIDLLSLELKDKGIIQGHNIVSFDLPFLVRKEKDIRGSERLMTAITNYPQGIHDTLIFSRKLMPQRRSHSMESLIEWLRFSCGTTIPNKVKIDDWSMDNINKIKRRVTTDCKIQYQLYKGIEEFLGGLNAVPNYENIANAFPMIVKMLAYGVPLDTKEMNRKEAYYRHLLYLTRCSLDKELDVKDVNYNSNKQIHELLLSKFNKGLPVNITIDKKTFSPKENPLFNKENKLSVIRKFPVLEKVVYYRQLLMQLSFLDSKPKKKEGKKSLNKNKHFNKHLGLYCVHPSLSALGTVTYRSQFKDPPLNQIDKRVREIVVAPKGWTIVGVDIVAMEFAIQAYVLNEFFGEDILVKELAQGVCPKQKTIDSFGELFDNVYVEVGKTKKDSAKTLNYAIAFGQGIKATINFLGLTMASKEEVYNAIDRTYPSLRRLQKFLIKSQDGDMITNIYGSKVPSPEYCIINYFIQSSGAEYSLMILGLYYRELFKHFREDLVPFVYNHDEIQFLVKGTKEEHEKEDSIINVTAKNIKSLWKKEYPDHDYITGLDVNVGYTWKETH